MKGFIKYIFILFAFAGVVSCVYPFTPDGVEEEVGILVMEGDINVGITSTFVPSRSISLTGQNNGVEAVDLTDIYVESESGEKFGLIEKIEESDNDFLNNRKVLYVLGTDALSKDHKCRLVFSVDSKTYMTGWLDFVPTPEIDSVTYTVAEDLTHLDIHVHTTGLNDTLRYFKWDYREDWEFNTYFQQMVYYLPDSNMVYSYDEGDSPYFYCWDSSVSTNINIFSTKSLSHNKVSQHPIKTIYNTDKRLSYLYAIEVFQKGLSEEAYKYWETLLKNNDGSAGIFAPQPNEMRGNIFCADDPDEMVLGYISCCDTKSRRIFIDRVDHRIYLSEENCFQESKTVDLWKSMYNSGWDVVDVDPISGEIFWAPRKCVDCRVNGTKNKPSFWPNDHK
ncbi:MAG: DUF4249 family protein [Bacteroidales bacterium]|nr:DUF4249 family protein [Bacteroidales bacterium]